MKNFICIIILTSALLLTACSDQTGAAMAPSGFTSEGSTPAGISGQNVSASGIIVKSPMTISNNLINYNGASAYLRLKMVKGKYYEDWNPGAFMGTIWEGSFILELVDEYGKSLAQTDLEKYYSEPLTFTSNFNLEFDDYNNDGNMDFTIGQYASSNGRVYRLFTLTSAGTVEELVVKDTPELFISNSSGYYSTKLQKLNNTTFKTKYYDNSRGKTYESRYEWKDNEFIGLGEQELKQADQ